MTEILEELPKLKPAERHIVFERIRELEGNPPPITGAELFKRWKPGSHLSPEEADAFARDIEEGRRFFKAPMSPWE